ncbi:MAG: sigma 54-interacting transcriptional regulator [Planctomycetota bacterium]|nr:sigma 54-interacting transcriptional regulator [Planctomycetota bacterium]
MKLSVLEEGTSSELQVDRPVITIGRAVDNDVRLTSGLVSRHHCRIESSSEGVFVVDLGSANGTYVNGERIGKKRIEERDKIQIGAVRIAIELERPDIEDHTGETQPIEPEADFGDVGLRTLSGDARAERENLRAFARISRDILRETELNALLRSIVDSAISLVGGERGFLLLAEKDSTGESVPTDTRTKPALGGVRVARSFDHADIAVPQSRMSLGIANQVFGTGRALLSVDAGRDDRFSGMASVGDLRLRSVMCLPIKIEERVEGVLYVDNRLQQAAFTAADLELAELFANMSAMALLNSRRVNALRDQNQKLDTSRRQIERLNEQLGRKVRDRDSELAVVRAELGRERGRYDYTAIVGASEGMRRVFQSLDRIIESELPVLISGESGTGKELIARAIHFNGPRAAKPFVTENCAALPDTLLESELFGHARGAFTGAHKQKKGLLEQADGGTLFLDEIGDMSAEMQKKLLRVLQEGEFRPVGSDQRIQVNVRLLAASHRNLESMVRDSTFREDLYYRVNVLNVRLPALRERREDIPLLAEALLARAAREAGRPVPILPHEVVAALVAHDWSGNVRELENEMRRLVVLAQDEVRLDLLSPSVLEKKSLRVGSVGGVVLGDAQDIRSAVADLEKRSIEAALAAAGGNKSKAANELGISRFALQRKIDKYRPQGAKRTHAGEELDEGVDADSLDDPAATFEAGR